MAIEKSNVVDAIGIDRETGATVLTAMDALDWDAADAHLAMLRAKIETYLPFVESGELLEQYPLAQGRSARVDVIFRFEPPAAAIDLISSLDRVNATPAVPVSWKVISDP